MSGKNNCKSPTGCVHRVSGKFKSGSTTFVNTKCNHMDYQKHSAYGYDHAWPLTDEPVTCKRCLKLIGNLCNCTIGYTFASLIKKDAKPWQTRQLKTCLGAALPEHLCKVFKFCPDCGAKNKEISL